MRLFAANGIQDAFSRATLDGLIIVGALLLLSIFSWSVMLSKLYVLRLTRKLQPPQGDCVALELFIVTLALGFLGTLGWFLEGHMA